MGFDWRVKVSTFETGKDSTITRELARLPIPKAVAPVFGVQELVQLQEIDTKLKAFGLKERLHFNTPSNQLQWLGNWNRAYCRNPSSLQRRD